MLALPWYCFGNLGQIKLSEFLLEVSVIYINRRVQMSLPCVTLGSKKLAKIR
jgi:hypothetical protein